MVINSVLLLYTRRRRMTCGPFSHPPSHRYIVIIITATDRSHRLHRHICATKSRVRGDRRGPPTQFRRLSSDSRLITIYQSNNVDTVSCSGYRMIAGLHYYYYLL
uniref:Uncharacterized protein n=1 Tax=Schizaphis graminum TaxID=13262 RepID=A0A2S2NV18_SCHGA